jgi:hypothetical protein
MHNEMLLKAFFKKKDQSTMNLSLIFHGKFNRKSKPSTETGDSKEILFHFPLGQEPPH